MEHDIKTENLWDQQWPNNPGHEGQHGSTETDAGEELSAFPEAVGTPDSIESVRDAEPYSPPIDPPVLPGGPEGIHVASGFSTSSQDGLADSREPLSDEQIRHQIVQLLRRDSLASQFSLQVAAHNGTVHLRGVVQSPEDVDYVSSLVDSVPGVVEVVDETTLSPTGT